MATKASKQPLERKIKAKPLSWYKKKLDALFSQYIRRKYADKEGQVKCYTCSFKKLWKELQNGHWIPRNNLATRFSEENCRPQCVACNLYQRGRPDVFAVNLIKEGVDLEALMKSKYCIFKVDRKWYENLIEKYQKILDERNS